MKNDELVKCRSTGLDISQSEMNYREDKKNVLVKRLQLQLGKTREQVLGLFRFYNKASKSKKV
ncbi:MAG: hypothetical protein K0Q66_893 [Chitinophagaceae bacterium]|jgi:hypothetical protein|nr:hypothetical protein [Chitinophagaceae bacterium]